MVNSRTMVMDDIAEQDRAGNTKERRSNQMKEWKNKRILLYGSITGLAALAAVLAVLAYRSENQFQPIASEKELQVNQVVFSGDDASAYGKDQEQKNDDEIWKKDQEAEDQNGPGRNGQADYLYEEQRLSQAEGGDSLLFPEQSGTQDGVFTDPELDNMLRIGGNSYELTDDVTGADWVISGSGIPGMGNGNGTGETSGSGNGSVGDRNTNYGNNGDNGNNGNHGNTGEKPGQNDGNPTASPSAKPSPMPTQRPADRAPQPDFGKEPSNSTGSPQNEYSEDKIQEGTGGNPNFVRAIIQKGQGGWTFLYTGQQIDRRTVYQALDTYVIVAGEDPWDSKQYYWGENDLDRYVRIDGISFDGGKNWITDFPVTIPDDVEDGTIQIKTSYRFSQKSSWTEEQIPYEVEPNCVYVLSKKLSEENPVIHKENILNNTMFFKLHVKSNEKINLYHIQSDFLSPYKNEDGSLSHVFPGWTEYGESVPWFYTTGKGRHILEPQDLIPVEDGYTIKLLEEWVTDDYEVSEQGTNLCYLQTLTSFNDDSVNIFRQMMSWKNANTQTAYKLRVPAYVQAVDIEQSANRQVDYLEIPDSVIYINNIDDGLLVYSGYLVDSANRNYKTGEDGMLLNQQESEILGIPVKVKEISIPETVSKVTISDKNQIESLTLRTQEGEEFPEINYENLPADCRIQVKDAVLEKFLLENYENYFADKGCSISTVEQPELSYIFKNNLVIDSEGTLRKMVDDQTVQVTLPLEVKKLSESFLEESPQVTKLILNANSNLTLSENCFAGSNLQTILCATKEQCDSIEAQMDKIDTGKKLWKENDKDDGDGVKVVVSESSNGFVYEINNAGDREIITLLSAPESVTSFEGKIVTKDGKEIIPTAIGDGAFASHTALQWVVLDEKTDTIGYQAFKNCTSLQGILIDNKNTITIGDKSLDGCSSLRFIASNARKAVRINDYNPGVWDSENNPVFYVPTNPDGYTGNSVYFLEENHVASYRMEKIGKTSRVLYGVRENGEPWLALRSGSIMDEHVELPSTTLEIYPYAFEQVYSKNGVYQIDNFGDLKGLYIDRCAFSNSGLNGTLTLKEAKDIRSFAFQGCNNLTKVSFVDVEAISAEVFAGCEGIEQIQIQGAPAKLSCVSKGIPFRLNSSWSESEENAKITVDAVNDDQRAEYVMNWRYLFAGYGKKDDNPAYLEMWENIYFQLIWDGGDLNDVDQEVKTELLSAENRVRTILGMEQVSEPTDYYPYHSLWGEITLVGVPSDKEEINLSDSAIELPDGASINYLAKNVLAGSSVKKLTVPATVRELESGVFAGTDGELTVVFEGAQPSKLTGWSKEELFTFGVKDDSLDIQVPEESKESYLNAWSCVLAGYSDMAELRSDVAARLQDQLGREPSSEEIENEINKCLLPARQRLCTMLGMELPAEMMVSEDGLETEEQTAINQKSGETDPVLNPDSDQKENSPEDQKKPDDPEEEEDPDSRKDPDEADKPDDKKEEESDNKKDPEEQGTSDDKDESDGRKDPGSVDQDSGKETDSKEDPDAEGHTNEEDAVS